MLISLLASAAFADDIGAIVRPEVAIDIAPDRDDEDAYEVHTFARVWAKGELERGDRWFLEVRAQHHVLAGTDVEGWWTGSVGESGWDGRITGSLRLRAGALVERWGKLDLLPLVDLLNPRDMRSGPMVPTELQRIPVPMAVLSWGNDTLRAETVWMPFAVADPIFLRETDWSYVRQGMLAEQTGQMREWPGETSLQLSGILESIDGSISTLDPSFRRGLDGAVNAKNLPQATGLTGDVAQRIQVDGGGVDAALMVGYLRSRQAAAALDPFIQELLIDERLPDFLEQEQLQEGLSGGALKVDWPRTGMVGLETSGLIDAVQVRGEAIYLTNKVVRTHFAGASTSPMLGAGLGLDYVRGSSLQITIEGRWQRLLDAPDDLIFALPDQVQVAGGVRGSLLSDRLSIQVGGSVDVTFGEYIVFPRVGWRASDTWLLEVGATVLGGPTPAPETLADAFQYSGGPASYFSQNDAVTFAVSWIR